MTPIEKDKIEAICKKWQLEEQNFTKGLFLAEDNSGITVNLQGDNPLIGVTIAGELHTEGHGNLRVQDLETEIMNVLTPIKSQSSKNDKKAEVKDDSHKITQRKSDEQNNVTTRSREQTRIKGGQDSPLFKSSSTEHSEKQPPQISQSVVENDKLKLSTPDTKPKLQKAKCKDCNLEFDLTLDDAKAQFEEYQGIYCPDCKGKPVKHKKEYKKEETGKDAKTEEHQTRSAEPNIATKTCTTCGTELSGARELECFQKDIEMMCEDCISLPKPKGVTNMDEKLPILAKISDHERDQIIETAKAKRFLENRGTSYFVQGKERPDAHKIQNVANERKISIEIIKAEQTDIGSTVIVRGHLGNQFLDACVHHDFATEYQLKAMEIIKKNPSILDHYEGTIPVIKEGAQIEIEEFGKRIFKDAKYYLVHTLLSFKKFSLRDARTKAASIAEAMLLNRDWRDEDEIQNELSEKKLIEESTKNRTTP
jgi:NAD-dependent SIR2 family protein deacetylase